LEVAWTGHAQRITGPGRDVATTVLANFGLYFWRKYCRRIFSQ